MKVTVPELRTFNTDGQKGNQKNDRKIGKGGWIWRVHRWYVLLRLHHDGV